MMDKILIQILKPRDNKNVQKRNKGKTQMKSVHTHTHA